MKKEIVALIDSTGVDGQQKKKQMWLGELRIVAWKEESILHTEEKSVTWATTYDGLVEMANIISKNMIVKLAVEDKGTMFKLLEVLQAPATDLELEQLQQKSKKPVYYQDKVLGKYKYDPQFNWYTKKVNWGNEKGSVYIHNAEPTLLNQQFEALANMLEASYLQQVKQFAAEEVALVTEEWTGKALTASDVITKLKFKELTMH